MNISMCFYSGHFLAIILGFTFGYYFLNIISPDFYASISDEKIGVKNEVCEQSEFNNVQPSTSQTLSYDQI
jgi:hypothetical protein